jgi:hypothetical protein
MNDKKPYIIEFQTVGEVGEGFISIAEFEKSLPFEVKRVFWTYQTPDHIVRGRHAHFQTQLVLVAAAGRIVVNTELTNGKIETFVLEKPSLGLYIPPTVWHTMQYYFNAVQLVFASTLYDENDYIRDYSHFQQLIKDGKI